MTPKKHRQRRSKSKVSESRKLEMSADLITAWTAANYGAGCGARLVKLAESQRGLGFVHHACDPAHIPVLVVLGVPSASSTFLGCN